eukprot:2639192-Amphidinium_carterae.1
MVQHTLVSWYVLLHVLCQLPALLLDILQPNLYKFTKIDEYKSKLGFQSSAQHDKAAKASPPTLFLSKPKPDVVKVGFSNTKVCSKARPQQHCQMNDASTPRGVYHHFPKSKI